MDFGIFNLMQQRDRQSSSADVVAGALELTRQAETLGFARVWFAEHHFSNYSLCPSPLVMAAYAAGITSRIRLGSAVIVPPLYAPARLIAEIGMVDTLSQGRLDIGVGCGYQPFEFDRFNVDIGANREMTAEMLDMVEAGLSQPTFAYEGKHYKMPQTAISVRPVQRPHPPIWNASKDEASVRRAARKGYAQFFSTRFSSVDELKPVRAQMDAWFRAEGREPEEMRIGLLGYCHVSDDRDAVRRYLDNARFQQRIARSLRERRQVLVDDYWVEESPFANEPTLDEAARHVLAGDVESVAERVVAIIREIRPSHMTFYFQVGDIPLKESIRSMERWAGEVVPAVEKALGQPLGEVNQQAASRQAAE